MTTPVSKTLSGRYVAKVDTGEDSVSPGGMLAGQEVYCGYGAGTFDNMASVEARFPGKKYISITPFVSKCDCLDIENGDAIPADAPVFVRQWARLGTGHPDKPVLYANASTMPAVESALSQAGVPRSGYYLWVAEWDGIPSIPSGFDGKQYVNTPTYDADSFYDYMFTAPVPPSPPLSGVPTALQAVLSPLLYSAALQWTGKADPGAGGAAGYFEWQVELDKGNGNWELIRQGTTQSNATVARGLEGAKNLRWRVSGGNWSNWQGLSTP